MRSATVRRVAAAAVLTLSTVVPSAARQEQPAPPAEPITAAQAPLSLYELRTELRAAYEAEARVRPTTRRRLAAMRRDLDLRAAFATERELDAGYRRLRGTVRSGYVGFFRDALHRELAFDDLTRRGRAVVAPGEPGQRWRLRVEPRFDLGDGGSVSTRLTLSDGHAAWVQRVSLELRGDAEGELGIALRYRDGERRFVQLERVTGDRETGERVAASVALRF